MVDELSAAKAEIERLEAECAGLAETCVEYDGCDDGNIVTVAMVHRWSAIEQAARAYIDVLDGDSPRSKEWQQVAENDAEQELRDALAKGGG